MKKHKEYKQSNKSNNKINLKGMELNLNSKFGGIKK